MKTKPRGRRLQIHPDETEPRTITWRLSGPLHRELVDVMGRLGMSANQFITETMVARLAEITKKVKSMAENTGISWCDKTFNPWIGCTKVSPACANCYAERDWDHRKHRVKWGPSGTRSVTADGNWKQPLKWNREAAEGIAVFTKPTGELVSMPYRPRVFCASLADVFEDWDGPMLDHKGDQLYHGWHHAQPDWVASSTPCEGEPVTMADVRTRLFALIDATPNLDYLLLTKRPENIRQMWPTWPSWSEPDGQSGRGSGSRFLKNCWLGCTAENQEYAAKRIPELLKCRDLSPVLFLSCEPLVGPVDVSRWFCPQSEGQWMNVVECGKSNKDYGINWVITGGESGPGARPADPDWFRSLRDQCSAAGVPFHYKQWGEWDEHQFRIGKSNAGRLLDGIEHNGFPEVVHAS